MKSRLANLLKGLKLNPNGPPMNRRERLRKAVEILDRHILLPRVKKLPHEYN